MASTMVPLRQAVQADHAPAWWKSPVALIGLLVVACIASVAGLRASGTIARQPDAPTVVARSLTFADRADGGIDVTDARSGETVTTVVGEAGFVRGTLRALARERRRAGLSSAEPLDLIAHSDGRLTLADRTTGQRIDLESFGPTNAAEFARMLPSRDDGRRSR